MTLVSPRQKPLIRLIALSLALAAAGSAPAQTGKEVELEARIQQLEQQLAELKAMVAAQQPAPAPAPAPGAPPPPPPIQATTITPGAVAGTKFTVGGFIRTDTLITDTDGGEIPDNNAGRDLYVPGGIPVGGAAEDGADYDNHIKFSRIWLGFDNVSDAGDKVSARLEFDVFGGALGNQQSTNTYGLTVRHAFVSWNQWLAGQTWSNFMDVAALPDSVDFIGATDATVFVRQAQLRYTNGPWSFALENPETSIVPFGGGAKFTSDDNSLPDFTARYTYKPAWGHLSAGLLVHQLAHETTGANRIDDRSIAVAGSFSGRYNFDANNDIRFSVTGGQAIGRYVGLGIAADAVIDADRELEAIDGIAAFVGLRHAFSAKLRGNLYYGFSQYDNDTALTGLGVTESVYSVAANLIYSPLPKLDVGVELRHAERELESGADGSLTRLHFLTRYSF